MTRQHIVDKREIELLKRADKLIQTPNPQRAAVRNLRLDILKFLEFENKQSANHDALLKTLEQLYTLEPPIKLKRVSKLPVSRGTNIVVKFTPLTFPYTQVDRVASPLFLYKLSVKPPSVNS